MPTSLAQLRATKKWNEANHEKHLNAIYEWRKIPDNLAKQAKYMKKYLKRRNAFLQEFRRLANILL
jgi:hypothetical protein